MSGSTSSSDEAPATATTAADDDWRYTGTPAPLLLAPTGGQHAAARRLAPERAHGVLGGARRPLGEPRTRRVNAALNTSSSCGPAGTARAAADLLDEAHERVAFQPAPRTRPRRCARRGSAADDARSTSTGCPVKFSLQGGMGSALLTQPEKVRDILTTLVRNLGGKPVTQDPAARVAGRDAELCRAIAERRRRGARRPRGGATIGRATGRSNQALRDALPKSCRSSSTATCFRPTTCRARSPPPAPTPSARARRDVEPVLRPRPAAPRRRTRWWALRRAGGGARELVRQHQVRVHVDVYGYGKTPHWLLQKAKDYPAMRAVAAMRADPAFAGRRGCRRCSSRRPTCRPSGRWRCR